MTKQKNAQSWARNPKDEYYDPQRNQINMAKPLVKTHHQTLNEFTYSSVDGVFIIPNEANKPQLWRFLRNLAFGTHEVRCSETIKNALKAMAWDYSERQSGGSLSDKRLHVLRVLTSMETGQATVTVREHKWLDDGDDGFSATYIARCAYKAILRGEEYLVECNAKQVQQIRVAVGKLGGMQVKSIAIGCVIRKPVKEQSQRDVARGYVRDVLSGKDVCIRVAQGRILNVRAMINQSATEMGVRIATRYKNGYLTIAKKASKDVEIFERMVRDLEEAGLDLEVIENLIREKKGL